MYISVDLAHHELFRAKFGKGGIMHITPWSASSIPLTSFLPHYCMKILKSRVWPKFRPG